MMIAIIACRMAHCDYLGGKGFSLTSLCQPVEKTRTDADRARGLARCALYRSAAKAPADKELAETATKLR